MKKIFLFQQREWSVRIGQFLTKKLISDGYSLGCLTFKPSTHQLIKSVYNKDYKLCLSHDEIYDNPEKFIIDPKITLEEISRDLNYPSLWKLVQSDRNIVRNYREKFNYSFGKSVDDSAIINYLKAIYFTCVYVHRNFKPDIIFSPNFVSIPHIFFNLFFKRKKTIMFATFDTKVGNNMIFVSDYLGRSGKFHDNMKLKKFNKINYRKVRLFLNNFNQKSKQYLIYNRSNQKIDLYNEIKSIAKLLRSIFRSFFYGNPNKNKLYTTLDDQNVFYLIRDYFCKLISKNQILNFRYSDLNKIDKFIFFPLQYQPEASLDVWSPLNNNQIETARKIAMCLPPDYTLVVKDHPDMFGFRNKSYINKISKLPNVKIIKPTISSAEVLDKSKLLIIISGSIAFEAAIKKKICIQLGDSGITNLLPNVYVEKNFEKLPYTIRKLMNLKIKKNYDKNLYYYIDQAFKCGFNSNYLSSWVENKVIDINDFYKKLKLEINFYLDK